MSDQTTSSYPNLNPGLQNAKDTVVNSEWQAAAHTYIPPDAANAYTTVRDHPMTQNITNGAVAQAAFNEKDKTASEFNNVIASKRIPDQKTATGQPLTHYHSMFYNILSWENPRITSICFASTITFIFFTRYVPVLKYLLKALYIVLGITAAAEVAGKLVFNKGLATQIRPRQYYTISRETLETALEDAEQLINFFVIEFQRVIFAENVWATVAAFTAALIGYWLVKIVPTWGLALIATSVIYLTPIIYISNKEVIDAHLRNAGDVLSQQTQQVRELAVHHTNRAAEVAKSTASEYTSKAQEMIGQAKGKAASPEAPNPANLNPMKREPERDITSQDLPSAPKSEPFPSAPRGEPVSELPSAAAHTDAAPAIVHDFDGTAENSAPELLRTEGVLEHEKVDGLPAL